MTDSKRTVDSRKKSTLVDSPPKRDALLATVRDMNVPLGAPEIAKMLDVQDRTVHQWIRRQLMPDADFPEINGSLAWDRDTVLRWAGTTGRLTSDTLIDEFTKKFRSAPVKPRKGGRLPSAEVAARIHREKVARQRKADRKAKKAEAARVAAEAVEAEAESVSA